MMPGQGLRKLLRVVAKISPSSRSVARSYCDRPQTKIPQDIAKFLDQGVNELEPVKLVHEVFEGDSSAPPVLFAHGLLGSKRNFLSIAKRLNKITGRTMVVADLRNHGDSPHTDAFSFELLALDLRHLIHNELQFESYVLLGHSLGAKAVALNALLWPESVEKLIAVDASPIAYNLGNRITHGVLGVIEAMQNINLKHIQASQPDTHVRSCIRETLYNQLQKDYLVDFILTNLTTVDRTYEWKCNLQSFSDNTSTIGNFPVLPTGLSYNGDTLFIGGEKSPYILKEHEPEIKRLFPNTEIVRVADAGHWVHADNPNEFIRLVSEFLCR